MAAIALVTAARVRIVESNRQMTLPCVEAVVAGQPVRIDTTTGKWTAANGSSAGEARVWGIAVESMAAGLPVTAVRNGVLDGYVFTAQAYDAAIYLSDTDATLADGAGTVSTIIGRVIPATGTTLGTAYDKLLSVEL